MAEPETFERGPDSSPDSLEGKTIKFRTAFDKGDVESRESDVLIKKEIEEVGRGAFSEWVKAVEASVVSKDGRESPSHTSVVKKFKEDGPEGGVVQDVKNALKNWKLLREAQVKTWDTYRASEDNSMIIM